MVFDQSPVVASLVNLDTFELYESANLLGSFNRALAAVLYAKDPFVLAKSPLVVVIAVSTYDLILSLKANLVSDPPAIMSLKLAVVNKGFPDEFFNPPYLASNVAAVSSGLTA